MGNGEDGKAIKPEKSSPITTDHTSLHVYPDWAAMQQAYYGPRVPVPPYFNPAVASGHPHPYMWVPPQSMMSPYGTPYPAIYPHGGVYAHPAVPIASAPMSIETPTKPVVNKLKDLNGLAISINGKVDTSEGVANNVASQSGEGENSSDGSNANTAEGGQNIRKRSREGTPINSGDLKGKSQHIPAITTPVNNGANTSIALEFGSPLKVNPISAGQTFPETEHWENERDLKRERRKQSNRESARRSRLRKQAEADELAGKVHSLATENLTLKSKINKLNENSEKLKLENALLMEKLKNVCGESETGNKSDGERVQQSFHTADLLARVNNNNGVIPIVVEENEGSEQYNKQGSGPKPFPVLSPRPRNRTTRNDAVAAR